MIDSEVGEIATLRLPPRTATIVEWAVSLPGPVAVAYEAGPTGFGLARALGAAGVRCEVVAPSKMARPPGDRVMVDSALRSDTSSRPMSTHLDRRESHRVDY